MSSLWIRIRDSKALLNSVAWLISLYIKFAFNTTRWQREGFDELNETLAKGEPVIVLCWHQRLVNAPLSWDHSKGKVAILGSHSRAGQINFKIQTHLGMHPIRMHDDASNVASSLTVAKLVKRGYSLGITGDGPEGPNREFNGVALQWARLTSQKIFLFSYATKKHWMLKTWDRMMIPKPFTKGIMLYQRWDNGVARNDTVEMLEKLSAELKTELDALTAKADLKASDL